MPMVSRGDDDDEAKAAPAAGAEPLIEFDPSDPDQVTVHYNLAGWTFEQRAELAESLAERDVPHAWGGDELLIPEQLEADVDALFDVLEAEIGPFPVPLLDLEASGVTEFGLDEWPAGDIELLNRSLIEAEIPHRWDGRTLLVARDAEHTVDELLDAIEAGEVASLDEAAEAPDGALHSLYVAADRLWRDPTEGGARGSIVKLAAELSANAPPYGLAVGAWRGIVDRAQRLAGAFEAGAEPAAIAAAADDLRSICRPYV